MGLEFIFYFFSRFHDRFFSTESRGQYIEACTTIHFPLELRIICYSFWAQGIFPSSFSFCLLRATNISLMMWDHRTTHFRPWKIIICLIFRKHVIHLVRGENLIALKSWNSRLDSPLRAVCWKACLYLYCCKRYRSVWGAEIFDRQEKVKAHTSQKQKTWWPLSLDERWDGPTNS